MWILIGKFAGNAVLAYLVIGGFAFLKSGVWAIDLKIFWVMVLTVTILSR